jgi:apolipoprotein N-acyltransferase
VSGLWTTLDGVAACLQGLASWRRAVCAVVLGAFATLALPPVDFLPMFILALTALIWLLGGCCARPRAAFLLGWWFGFGYFAVGLYWIGNALLVFSDQHAWMLPFAALGLPAFLATFIGAATLCASYATGRLATALALAAALAAADWLRGHILTGLPWNLFGHTWSGIDPLLQSAAYYGIYGTGIVALVAAVLPAVAARGPSRQRWGAIGLTVSLIAGHWIAGEWRLPAGPMTTVADTGIRLVQANIPQREKWARQFRSRNIGLHYRLSLQDRPDWVTHVVWPEMAATLYLAEDEDARRALARVVPEGGLLLTGAPRREARGAPAHNAILALDTDGAIVGHYDKAHLVPFGEYVPLASLLPIEKITQGALGYAPGLGVRTLRLRGLPPASLLVCYEIIFPGHVVDALDRPGVILNLTNDAWYGATAGPHQHFANARVRAVEEGLPVVRAAYTGISGAVDPYGRVVGIIPLDEVGFLDIRLPDALADAPPYARYGDWIFAILLGMAVVVAVFLSRRAKSL